MGDNRDLAGLVMLGIIGDGQELAGKNLEIFNDGVGNGIISPKRGMRLPGRDSAEQLYMALHPYLDDISGDESLGADLIEMSTGKDGLKQDALLSLIVLTVSRNAPLSTLQALYGDLYDLEREVIEDAHALAAVVDACGKAGQGGLAASLCLRSSRDLAQAWEVARVHRINVIRALMAAQQLEGSQGFYEVQDFHVASDVADTLAADRVQNAPVVVFARAGDSCHLSVRAPERLPDGIGTTVRELALACGGTGGGHRRRAGATIPCGELDRFRKGFAEAVPV
jgi:hypothetical protein